MWDLGQDCREAAEVDTGLAELAEVAQHHFTDQALKVVHFNAIDFSHNGAAAGREDTSSVGECDRIRGMVHASRIRERWVE